MTVILRKLSQLPKKLLVARTDRIGDFVLALPVFEALMRYIHIDFTVLCQSATFPLLKGNPYIDQVIQVSPDHLLMSTVERINDEQFDGILVLVNDPLIRQILPKLKHIPIKIGPLSKPQVIFQYTHPVIQRRSMSIKNEAEYNLDLLKIFEKKFDTQIRPTLYVGEDETRVIRTQFAEVFASRKSKIILHTGMSGSALNWPVHHYQELLKKLQREGFVILMTGASEDESRTIDRLISNSSQDHLDNTFNLSQELSLRELGVLISQCDLFIGPSTGPTHIASAVRTPVVSFYPPILVQSSLRWEPYLAKASVFTPKVSCKQKFKCKGENCADFFCMEKISVDHVFQKVFQILDQTADRVNC